MSSNMDDFLIKGGDCSTLPALPLYLALKKLPEEKTAFFLTKCSAMQREYFLDMDLWNKDELDCGGFSYWIRAYYHCADSRIKQEFVKSDAFFLYLKGRFNLTGLDGEDPVYPDHDNFFITDDNMILVEHHPDFPLVQELKSLLSELYDDLGVEAAWARLFKIMGDSFFVLREEEYLNKKERTRDLGIMDYYDALSFLKGFSHRNAIDYFIKNQKGVVGTIDDIAAKQWPHPSALTPWQHQLDEIVRDFVKVEEKRKKFLLFDFTRLINGTLALQDVIKKGSIAVARAGIHTKNRMSLGYWYTRRKLPHRDCLFESFSFSDFYKIGRSLVAEEEKQLRKILRDSAFSGNNAFLGSEITRHLNKSYDEFIKATPHDEENIPDMYIIWANKNKTVADIVPYAERFYRTFDTIVKNRQIQDDFYINYKIDEMDFESLLISNFINFILGHRGEKTEVKRKLAITIDEFKKFYPLFFNDKGELKFRDRLRNGIEEFSLVYGLDKVFMFVDYFTIVVNNHLTGYKTSELKKEEFRYVGGPIIFEQDGENSLAHSSDGI
ncbi:MAG: DUF6178 family protein [Halobacteriovoraceae bacterium]|nr:DUF6178 family protein [Halobacteriovoraceae bacterium]